MGGETQRQCRNNLVCDILSAPQRAMVLAGPAVVEERSPAPPAPLWVTKMATKPPPATFQPPNSLCELQMGVYNLLYAYFGIRHNTACPGEGSWWEKVFLIGIPILLKWRRLTKFPADTVYNKARRDLRPGRRATAEELIQHGNCTHTLCRGSRRAGRAPPHHRRSTRGRGAGRRTPQDAAAHLPWVLALVGCG